MKRIACLFLSLFTFFSSASYVATAQNSPAERFDCTPATTPISLGTPIKAVEQYPDLSVSYYEYNNSGQLKGCFMRQNLTAYNALRFDVPDNIYVKDFVQMESSNIIAFCGYRRTTDSLVHTEGVVGWFTFNTGANDASFYYMVISDVKYFEAVNAYYYQGMNNIEIYAIAKEVKTSVCDGIFHTELNLASQTLVSHNYDLYVVDKWQHFYNIVGTDEYIVFVGTYENGLCLRREHYLSMSSPVELNNCYCYPTLDGEPSTKTKATYLGNRLSRNSKDIVIGSSTYISDSQIETRFRVVETASMSMVNSQKVILPEKIDVYGLAYTMDNRMLPTLFSKDPMAVTSNSTVVLLEPYNTFIYTPDYYYDDGNSYKSIDAVHVGYSSITHFLLSTFGSKLRWFVADPGLRSHNSQCYDLNNARVLPIQNIVPIIKTNPLPPNVVWEDLILEKPVLTSESVMSDCL